MRGVGLAIAFAVTVGAVAAPTRAAGSSPAHAEHAARGKPPRKLVPVHFSCADALEDGTLIDSSQAASLTKLTRQLTWPEIGPPPELPPRDVRVFCGPDIDGDGERDAIVRLAFDNPENTASTIDADQLTYTWLASKHGGSWRALGKLTADVTGDRDVQQNVAFVRRAQGQFAIEIERSSYASETGCRITGYEVMAWRAGALATVEAGDRSPACAPCGCDQK